MPKEMTPPEQKKKPLPPGVSQVGFKEYAQLHKQELEDRQKKKKALKTTDKVVQIVLVFLGVPLLGMILYFGIALLLSMSGK